MREPRTAKVQGSMSTSQLPPNGPFGNDGTTLGWTAAIRIESDQEGLFAYQAGGVRQHERPNQRLRHQADSKHRRLGRVEKLHAPFGILLKVAAALADEIAADLGQFFPRVIAACQFARLRSAGALAVFGVERKQRHAEGRSIEAARGL